MLEVRKHGEEGRQRRGEKGKKRMGERERQNEDKEKPALF